jgi:hypothetical protein
MISIVINADTRPPMDRDVFTVGDDGGQGSLHGCRSWDYLTELPKTVHKFFAGHEHEVILDIDLHQSLPPWVHMPLDGMVDEGWLEYHMAPKDHVSNRWNDRIYLSSLHRAKGDYVVHLDQDCALYRDSSCNIVDNYLSWLNEGRKFICQPTNLTPEEHKMWWASTRFFICKRETLDFDYLWFALDQPSVLFNRYPWSGPHHFPCLEHLLGVIGGGFDGVLYPKREDANYLIFNWARYCKGNLAKLNSLPYPEVKRIVSDVWGLCGPNDVIATPL